MEHERSGMYPAHSALPRPGASKIPPPISAAAGGRVLHEVPNPNHDAMMMPPPSADITASLKQKSSSSSIGRDIVPKRITLAERGAQPGKGPRTAAAAPGRNPHSRSVSGTSVRNAPPADASKSLGTRPSSAQAVGRPTAQPPRPASAQGSRGMEKKTAAAPAAAPAGSAASRKGWDVKGRLEDAERSIEEFRAERSLERKESNSLREQLDELKGKVYQHETMRVTLETKNTQTQFELESVQRKASELERFLDDERRDRRNEREDAARRLRDETDDLRKKLRDEVESITKSYRESMDTLERKLKMELEDEKSARSREVHEVRTQAAMEKQRLEMEMDGSGREIRGLKSELDSTRGELEREKAVTASLKNNLSEQSSTSLTLESSARALRARIEVLESDGRSKMQSVAELEAALNNAIEETRVAKEKLRSEETLRRKLHNQVQELKGNIRVFCRVRPTLEHEATEGAEMTFPDTDGEGKEIEIVGAEEKRSNGTTTTKIHPFSFDKVFGPTIQNNDIFDEISQLVQSALDGYNVCIFCYGQTGSGKTYTMSADDGMIPQAVHQIYKSAKELEEKGWTYTMEGSFVEVYNENINDLLGKADDFDKKKLEIRHDPKESKTTITDVTTVTLDNPSRVESILRHASKTRSVAATKANERSSRSHSVFILKLLGTNSVTGEKSEGTLNLVDLAGSERLAQSQATGDRLKETQNINRSLSCLGDVIAALGNGKEGAHIPYRNSKLTYLLQYSLGGNSKCLMFVMVSPMQAHLNETLTSLKFATKVNNTSIGTAKKQVKSVEK